METEFIQIEWDGPYTFDEAKKMTDGDTEKYHDFGIYQIYGHHIVYGQQCLLYIGKAQDQTFGVRLSQAREWEEKYAVADFKNISVYVGRLAGEATPEDDQWRRQINIAEKMLICIHSPARNSSNLQSFPIEDCRYVHVLNWGSYRDLLPEVSGARYTDRFLCGDASTYGAYGTHRANSVTDTPG